jgi:hypothetical protein
MADTLLKFDEIQDAWLGLGDTSKIEIDYNPLKLKNSIFENNPGLLEAQVLTRPEYIGYATWALLNIRLQPFQMVIMHNLFTHAFPMFIGSRGLGKTFLLGIYSLLKCLFNPEYKVVLAGASFRQSKLIFQYAENAFNNSPVFRSVCQQGYVRHDTDRHYLRINDSEIVAIPIGPTGDKIRGLRANTIICDEFAAHNPEIYETILAGFAAVSASPSEAVVNRARIAKMKELNIPLKLEDRKTEMSNQSIISGTADYYFNHFYDYWKRYQEIIESRGDLKVLSQIMGGEVPHGFDWRDYCVIRMPYHILPKGFMDEKVMSRGKATMNKSIFQKEYSACFQHDSDGFFRRSLIESCVASDKNILKEGWVDWCPTPFHAAVKGSTEKRYIFGIDPASERDNFAIVILEVYDTHSRIVHSWTTNKENFKDRKKAGFTVNDDYYGFCARKIRDLMKVFPCHRIALDMQGGGIPLSESLHDRDKMHSGEEPLWEIINYDKPKDSDTYKGQHIIYPVQFASANWVSEANHNLRKDLEDRRLLFPEFDPLTIELSMATDGIRQAEFEKKNPGKKLETIYDSLEDCVLEIEALKDELTSIIMMRTGAGINSRERWTVPEVKIEGNKKSAGRKDRYSALLMANAVARTMKIEKIYQQQSKFVGGLVGEKHEDGEMYTGPDWFKDGMKNL